MLGLVVTLRGTASPQRLPNRFFDFGRGVDLAQDVTRRGAAIFP